MPGALRMSKLELVVDHDDVRTPAGGIARLLARDRKAIGDDAVGFQESVLHEVGDGVDAGARELRQVAVVEEAFPGVVRPDQRQCDEQDHRRGAAGGGIEPSDAERIEAPEPRKRAARPMSSARETGCHSVGKIVNR